MNDNEILQSRLKTERPAVPEGFAQRQDALLGSLRHDCKPTVRRMPRLAIVAGRSDCFGGYDCYCGGQRAEAFGFCQA